MTSKQILQFLRPSGVVVFAFLIYLTIQNAFQRPASSVEDDRGVDSAAKLDGLLMPTPELSPEQVVAIQLAGLSNPDRAAGSFQCMCFASPRNRAFLGSLAQFVSVVRMPPFDVLSAPDNVLIGKTTYIGADARVLVTLSSRAEISSFVWVLTRQTIRPYENCWMTDAVLPLNFRGDQSTIRTGDQG